MRLSRTLRLRVPPEALQLIVCSGPKCSRMNRRLPESIGDAARRIAAESDLTPVYVGQYECLARCAAAPSLLVKTLNAAEDPGDPGLFALEGSVHYGHMRGHDVGAIVDAHAGGDTSFGALPSEEY